MEECREYNISEDTECELEGKVTDFTLQLSLTSTVGLRINPMMSTATVTIDDTREPECRE